MSSRSPFRRHLFALIGGAVLGVLAAAPGWAQRADLVVLTPEKLAGTVILSGPWRYHPGDDPAWADPSLDDSGWSRVRPALREPEKVPGGWPGIGWFRRRVATSAEVGDAAIGLYVEQAGASEIYLDGRLVVRFGTVSASAAEERPTLPQYVAAITLQPGVEHVLAVRYSNASGNVLPQGRGFTLYAGEIGALTALGVRLVRRATAFTAGVTGLFGAFALLHLLLFVFRPRSRENLFFALFAAAVVGCLLSEAQMNAGGEMARVLLFFKGWATFSIAIPLTAMLLERHLFRQRIGPTFYLFAAAAAGLLLWFWTRPVFSSMLPLLVFLVLAFCEMLRLAVAAMMRREPEAWVVGAGFLILTLAMFAGILRHFELLPFSPLAIAVVGLGALALAFSVHLSRRFVHVNRQLEARLREVETLTAKTLEQERQVAREEAERRLLEADQRRRAAELEEARQLQLAMLPHELPQLEGFEIAVHMATANEVGGDYYDFSRGDGATRTLAVGDAIGHGLHAGMVVAVAKSLFQAALREPSLTAMLESIGTALAGMHRRVAKMAMVLVRLDRHRLRIASAGMPPVLIWRSAGRTVEEVLLPGLPLGAAVEGDGHFDEREVDVHAGDTVLIMSDGLAEATNAAGEVFGYERASRRFAELAHLEPAAVIERLVATARDFLAGTPLRDDMTLVVLEARA